MRQKIKVGVIGFGRMGRGFVSVMQQDDRWEIVSICDTQSSARDLAARTVPSAKIISDPKEVFADRSLNAVGLFTLADARPDLIRQALRKKLHIIAEKPIAADAKTEWALVEEISATRAAMLRPVFDAQHGRNGRLSIFFPEAGSISRPVADSTARNTRRSGKPALGPV